MDIRETGCTIMLVGIIVAIALNIFFPEMCNRKHEVQVAKRQPDHIDSIATGEYVIVAHHDSLYHYSLKCSLIGTLPKIVTDEEALRDGMGICPECTECETVYSLYQDGEYISIEECEKNNN